MVHTRTITHIDVTDGARVRATHAAQSNALPVSAQQVHKRRTYTIIDSAVDDIHKKTINARTGVDT